MNRESLIELTKGMAPADARDFAHRVAPATDHFDDNHFGVCPTCKTPETVIYRNIGRVHFGCCDEHKVAWPIGFNLFSSWRCETEEDWRRNAAVLVTFEEIEPGHCDCDECAVQAAAAKRTTPMGEEFAPF